MITLNTLHQMWSVIADDSQQDRQVPAQELTDIRLLDGYPLLVIDGDQQHHLLIPIKSTEHHRGDKQSGGIHLLINKWGINDKQQLHIDVVCLKPHLNELFNFVIIDVLSRLSSNNSQSRSIQICLNVLEHWRELFQREQIEKIDQQLLVGLFGELIVLRELMNYSPTAIQRWVGPLGACHDFINQQVALEVKTSGLRKNLTVTIHGLDQLEAPLSGKLYLLVIIIEKDNTGESLRNLVSEILQRGCDEINLLSKLARLGITESVLVESESCKFRTLEQLLYVVDENFPKIIKSSFNNPSDIQKISHINYQVDLSNPPPYTIKIKSIEKIYAHLAS